jgi:hypothetical protein
VPRLEHHTLVETLRDNPDLAPSFLANRFGIAVPPYASVRIADPSLDQRIWAPLQADLVVELCDERGAPVLAIVFEA